MPRNRRNSRKNTSTNDFKFINCRLQPDQKEAVDEFVKKNSDDIDGLLEILLTEGYKVSLSYSDYQDSFSCSFTGRGEDCPNDGLILTSFAGTAYEAIFLSLFKHNVLFDGGQWEEGEATSAWG